MKIAILDDYQSLARSFADWSGLEARAGIDFFPEPIADRDTLIAALQPYEVLGVMRERTAFPAKVIEALPNLRLIVTTGLQNASIDVAAAAGRGVTVCGTPGLPHPTAELAFAMILALARRLVPQANALREGQWQSGIGRDLYGSTLGVIGLGKLGARLVGFGKAFGMDVIAWSQNLTAERCAQAGVTLVGKEDLFRRADFVSIHLRLSERTKGLVGAAELALMKPDAVLVNSSRGPIVDTGALIAALRDGRIAGAGLDVYDVEPLPQDHPLFAAPNLLLTPHVGYVTRETYRVFYGGMVEAIAAWLDGAPVRVIGG